MATPWVPTVSPIIDGEAVAAKTPNRPILQLEQRTKYLFEQVQRASAGEALVARNVNLAADTIPGSPVYYDPVTNKWALAKATVSIDSGSYGFADNSAYCRGVVLVKNTANTGDILLNGHMRAEDHGIDWLTVTDDGAFDPGVYFVSAQAGKLSKSRSHVSVFFGNIDAAGDLFFSPFINGSLRDHLHYRYDLVNAIGATLGDQGWVPVAEFTAANIPSPPGTVYGYNVSLDTVLSPNFPLVNEVGAALYRDGVLLVDDDSVYVIDSQGIWWLSATTPEVVAPGDNTPMTLWSVEVSNEATTVSSLATSDDAEHLPLTIQNPSSVAASYGDLVAFIDQFFPVSPDMDTESDLALTDSEGAVVKFGPRVGRIIPGDGISIEAGQGDADAGFYGATIKLSAGIGGGVRGNPQVASMVRAREDFYGHIPAVTFPQTVTSTIRYQSPVPDNVLVGSTFTFTVGLVGMTTQAISIQSAVTIIPKEGTIPQQDTALPATAVNLVEGETKSVDIVVGEVNPGDTVSLALTVASPSSDVPVIRTSYLVKKG